MGSSSNFSDNKAEANNTQPKLSGNDGELKPRTFPQLFLSYVISRGIVFLVMFLFCWFAIAASWPTDQNGIPQIDSSGLSLDAVPWVLSVFFIPLGFMVAHNFSRSNEEISKKIEYSSLKMDQGSFRKMLVDYLVDLRPNSYKARQSDDTNLLFRWNKGLQIRVRLFPNRAQVVGSTLLLNSIENGLRAFDQKVQKDGDLQLKPRTFSQLFRSIFIFRGIIPVVLILVLSASLLSASDLSIGTIIGGILVIGLPVPMFWWFISAAIFSRSNKEISMDIAYSSFKADRVSFRKMLVDYLVGLKPNSYKARYSDDTNLLFQWNKGLQIRVRLFPDRAQVVGSQQLLSSLESRLEFFTQRIQTESHNVSFPISQNEKVKTSLSSPTMTDKAKLLKRAEQIEEELPKLKKEVLRAYSSSNDADMAQIMIAGIEEGMNKKSSGTPSRSPINRSKELEDELALIREQLAKMNENLPLNSKVQELFKSKNVDGLRDVARSEGNAITEFLVSALANDPDPQVKIMAIDALGLTSDPWAVRVLIRVFEDSTGGHRETAALSLANIVANRVKSSEALPSLMLIAKDKSIKTAFRVQAVTAICRFWDDDDAVKQFLTEIVNNPSEDMDIQMAIVNNM